MLLTPFIAAAILLREIHWLELVALVAVAAGFAIKDPLIVLARQQFVWRTEHPETRPAAQVTAVLLLLLAVCGMVLVIAGDRRQFMPFIFGAVTFTVLTVAVNVRNKQRSEWFQAVSAAGLSATCLIACLAAIGRIPDWCWFLWILSTLQSAAGIFVIHSRLDARIAARRETTDANRRTAFAAMAAMICAGLWFLYAGRFWVAAALILSAMGFFVELKRQMDPRSLQMPLTRVGLQALAQSIVYTSMVVIGLWER
jgi:hypothetical protein